MKKLLNIALLISFVVTILVFAAAGLVTKWIIGKEEDKNA